MSELRAFMLHARKMAEAEHKPECARTIARWEADSDIFKAWTHRGWTNRIPDPGPRPPCSGCVTDADRVLWARLAAEVDAYLSHDEEDALL